MSDAFIFRLMLVIIAIVIMFALVIQHNRNKSYVPSSTPAAEEETFVGGGDKRRIERFDSPSISTEKRQMVAPPPMPAVSSLNKHIPFNSTTTPAAAAHDTKTIDPAPWESLDTEMYRTMDYKPEANKIPQKDPFPKDRLTKDDLLPKDAANTTWAQVNPAGQGDLENVNLLDAGWNFGIDTQGQTLKNPNLQIRSEFPNPRADTGPWNKSTIETDCSRRYFEIGEP